MQHFPDLDMYQDEYPNEDEVERLTDEEYKQMLAEMKRDEEEYSEPPEEVERRTKERMQFLKQKYLDSVGGYELPSDEIDAYEGK